MPMPKKKPSLPKRCLAFCSLFEAELLVELMLRHWNHPMANDPSYRNGLLHSTAEVLKESDAGGKLMEDVPPPQMSFVSAMWYAEWVSIQEASEDPGRLREEWLMKV